MECDPPSSDEEDPDGSGLVLRDFVTTRTGAMRFNPKRMPLPAGSLRENFVSILQEQVKRVISGRYTPATWRRHTYLGTMLRNFARATKRHASDETAILALQWIGTGTSHRTLLGYARSLRTQHSRFRTDLMDSYIKGLTILAAQEPIKQAAVLSKGELLTILERAPTDLKMMIWLTYMTASRWADTQGLSGSKLLFSPESITVDFQGVTKTSRTTPHRIDHLVAIPRSTKFAEEFVSWSRSLRVWPRISLTTVTQFLRRITGKRDASAHSLKRTALGILLRAVADGTIPMRLVAQMGKHLGLEPALPNVTVGYIHDRRLLAATNSSEDAVAVLDLGNRHYLGVSADQDDLWMPELYPNLGAP